MIVRLERNELFAVLNEARKTSERDFLMLLVAYLHGLRASEVVALTADNFRDGFLTVARLKGSLRTTQPLVEHKNPLLNEKALLFEFLKTARLGARLFPITRQHFWWLFRRYAERANVPAHKRHPHVLKHTLALDVIDSAGVHNARQYLGHKSLSSTGEYLRVSDEQASAAIRSALESQES